MFQVQLDAAIVPSSWYSLSAKPLGSFSASRCMHNYIADKKIETTQLAICHTRHVALLLIVETYASKQGLTQSKASSDSPVYV